MKSYCRCALAVTVCVDRKESEVARPTDELPAKAELSGVSALLEKKEASERLTLVAFFLAEKIRRYSLTRRIGENGDR